MNGFAVYRHHLAEVHSECGRVWALPVSVAALGPPDEFVGVFFRPRSDRALVDADRTLTEVDSGCNTSSPVGIRSAQRNVSGELDRIVPDRRALGPPLLA